MSILKGIDGASGWRAYDQMHVLVMMYLHVSNALRDIVKPRNRIDDLFSSLNHFGKGEDLVTVLFIIVRALSRPGAGVGIAAKDWRSPGS